MDDVAFNTPSWEIKRELSPGYFRIYAHGYWRPFVVVVWGRVLIGKRGLRKSWERYYATRGPQDSSTTTEEDR